MFDQYKHKIKTVEKLKSEIGPRPREKRVAMCHGTFDIVHPGHVRHLYYAKSKGDLLIASLTCDAHVYKGEERPYVPEDLRALNLAALDLVDYVLIDPNPKPLENIAALEPDFFVKGFEYSADGIHPATQEEMAVVDSYGGEFVFTPGDIVYSSTELLSRHKPKLTLEKLSTLMGAEGFGFEEIHRCLNSFTGVKAHVVGDTIIDKYSHCSLLGPSTKTPTLSVRLEDSRLFLGGAGIVAKHLASLGAEVVFTTVLGRDEMAEFAVRDLAESGIKVNGVRETGRPTTLKERFWSDSYKLLQVDQVDNSPLSTKYVGRIAQSIEEGPSELVVFSDFRHGLFYKDSIRTMTEAIPRGAVKVADSQVASRWGNILDFKGFDLITPNEREARFSLADQDTVVRFLAEKLIRASGAGFLLLKMGQRGLLAYRQPQKSGRNFFVLDSFVDSLVDATGAGDALLAAASLALVRSQSLSLSSILGNVAAAVACEMEGNVPLGIGPIARKLGLMEQNLKGMGS